MVGVSEEREWDPYAANIYSNKHKKKVNPGKTAKCRHVQGRRTKLTTSTHTDTIHRRTTPDKEHEKHWSIYTQGEIGTPGNRLFITAFSRFVLKCWVCFILASLNSCSLV